MTCSKNRGHQRLLFKAGSGLLTPKVSASRSFFAYKYLHSLQGSSIATSDPQALLATKGGDFSAVIWDFEPPNQKISNRPFFTSVIPASPAKPVQLQLNHLVPNSSYHLEVHRTGYRANDAYTAYIEMGSPKELTKAEVSKLNNLTQDFAETDQSVESTSDGTLEVSVPMKSNDVVLIKLERKGGQLSRAGLVKASR